MRRSYKVRDKSFTVDELPDLAAARVPAAAVDDARRQGVVWQGEVYEPAAEDEVPLADRAPLEAAGWVLLSPTGRAAAAKSPSLPEPLAMGRLYRDSESGELMINAGRLTVRLDEGLDAEAARKALDRYGLVVKRELRFAPNLFEVEAQGRPALEAANDAVGDKDYRYAEPQMIKKLGHR